jgi:DNA-binding transcriptional LysR family regulator
MNMTWTDRIGRRVKLRDLHILLVVAQWGSISRAAERLAISHPVVSRTISDLERVLGVRLFDRGPQGIEPTMFGRALLDCGIEVFDDLRRGVQQIEFLSDPTVGEVRIGGTEPMMAGFIPAIVDRLASEYPRLAFHTVQGDGNTLLPALHKREIDMIVSNRLRSIAEEGSVREKLFDEQLFVVAGVKSRWVRRRKINLSELNEEHWILPAPDTMVGKLIADGFHSEGLRLPTSIVVSNSIPLRIKLLSTGRYISVLPGSMLYFGTEQTRLKTLPIEMTKMIQPAEITILKNRTPSPTASLFIECSRVVSRLMKKVVA